MKTVLRRTQPTPPPLEQLTVGSLVVDAATHEVRRGGEEISLTAKEFDLLWFLASNPNRVFSRDQLMHRVWGYSSALDTGTVTVHVRRLREKLERIDPRRISSRRCGVSATGCVPHEHLCGRAGYRRRRSRRVGSPRAAPTDPPVAARRARAGDRVHAAGVVLASGLVMFGMHHDVAILGVAIVSTLTALAGAYLLGRRIIEPLGRLRATSARLAAGELGARASDFGPRELRASGTAFNDMAAGLERLFDARRELVVWASHDLRTPLASLRAMTEGLEDGLVRIDELSQPSGRRRRSSHGSSKTCSSWQ